MEKEYLKKKCLYSVRDRFASGEKGREQKSEDIFRHSGSTFGGNLIDCFTKRLLLQIIGVLSFFSNCSQEQKNF